MAQTSKPQLVDQWGQPIRSAASARREAGRPRAQLRARYDAAQTTPENSRHWANADLLGAGTANNAAVRATLRRRARYEFANNCYCSGMVRTLAWHTVGTGPRLQFLADENPAVEQAAAEALNESIEWAFTLWAREIRLADKLRTMRQAKCRDGETFAQLITNPRLSGPVKLDLRVIEADQVANPLAANSPQHIDGIEFDAAGNPVAYHVLLGHPGEVFSPAFGNPLETRRVPAENMIHLFRRDRPGQVRGVPEITPALPLYAILRRYTLAALSTAEMIAAMTLFMKSNTHGGAASEVDAWEQLEIFRNTLTTLPDGWEPFQIKSEQPAANYEMFVKAIIREIARCLDMPFNVAAGDSSGYNYSSGRLDHQTYYRSINIDRSDLDLDCLDVILRAWLDEAMLAGVVPQLGEWSHTWFWPENDEIDPEAAANAANTLKTAGLQSDADYFGRRQLDWRDQYRQLGRERRMRIEQGIATEADLAGVRASAEANAPTAEFGGLSRLQWTRNRRAINDVLQELIDGKSTATAAQTMLESLGLSPDKAAALIADATDDGTVDDPAMQLTAHSPLTLRAAGGPIEGLQAAATDGTLPTFNTVAYSGGPMRLPGINLPVVVDLASCTLHATLPALRDHDFGRIVGHYDEATNTGAEIRARGVVSGTGADATEVVSDARNGFQWQASIGGDIGRLELVAAGQTVTVNQRQVSGPLYISRGAVVREISFTAVGADSGTHVSIAASASNGALNMDFESWVRSLGFDLQYLTGEQATALRNAYEKINPSADSAVAATQVAAAASAAGTSTLAATAPQQPAAAAQVPPVRTPAASSLQPPASSLTASADVSALRNELAAEHERIASVTRICNGNPTLQAQAIREGWTAQTAELHVLRASRAAGPAIHVAQSSANWQTLQAAACQALSLPSLEQDFDAPTLQAAHTMFRGRIGLQELLLECAWQNGFVGRRFRGQERAVLRAAFSTNEASAIFSNLANKFLLTAYMAVERTYAEISASRPVDDFKATASYRLTGDMKFEEVGADGELAHGTIADQEFGNQAKSYGKLFTLTRKHLVNDDLGALEQIPRMIGRGAALKVNEVFWKLFMNNGSFFTAGRNNYGEGAGTALSLDGLTALELMFLNQTDSEGEPLGVDPAILLVPNALHVTATNLMNSLEVRDTTASTKGMTRNPHAGKFRVKKSSYLHNTGYTGYSTKAHYLLADPADLPVIEIAYLNGQQQPTVEEVELEADVLGLGYRGFFDFGIALQDYRGGAKHKGEA